MHAARTLPPPAAALTVRLPHLCLAALAALAVTAAAAHAEPLRGRVLGPDGRPVPGATVVVTSASAAPLSTTTGDDGSFTVDAAPGIATVRAWAPGMAAPVRRVPAGTVDLEMHLALHAVSESLTVTASYVAVPASTVPDSVSVVTREDLERRQTTTLGDALRLVPGFAVAASGGPGTVTSAFPRGGESDFTLVLVDGVRANAFGGGMDLSQVPIAGAERIEVVRGPQSALYGSDAIGGVIQIVTARGGPAEAAALVEAGGRDWTRGDLTARGERNGWRGAVSGAYQRDGGFTGIAPADGSRVSNDDSTLSQVLASAGWRATAGTEAGASLHVVDTDRGAPGPYGSNPAGNFGGVVRDARGLTRRRAAALHLVQPLGDAASRVRVRADADVADFDLEFRSAFGSRGDTRRAHGRVQVDAALTGAVGLSAGADLLREAGRSTFITAGAAEVPVERGAAAAFAEVRWQGGGRGSLAAGLRAERITRDALAADPNAFSPRPAFDADTLVSVNPKVTAAWTLVPASPGRGRSTRLRAAAGTGIRPPDAFEIAFTDNPGLRPERSVSLEAGITQIFAGGAVQADVTGFHNRYDDLIVSVGQLASTSRFRTDNIANARARGIETSLAWRPTAAFSARGHYTWLDTSVLAVDGAGGQAPPPFRVGDPLLRRPRHQGAIDLTWGGARLQAFATAALRGATLDVEPSFGAFGGMYENPGYAVVSLGAAWRLGARLTLHTRVMNALDTRYEDVYGYPALGRTVYAGLRAAVGR
ncbi:MAG: TonB-dependent receptor [Vicinamibacterales bacterium]